MLIVPISKIQVQDYNVYVTGVVSRLEAGLSPIRPKHLKISFAKDHTMPLPNVIGTLTIDPAVPADNVTARSASVILDGAPAILVDLTAGPNTFPCLVGQAYSIIDIDSNAIGASLPSNVLTGTVSVTGPVGTVPTTPTGLSVSFAAAP